MTVSLLRSASMLLVALLVSTGAMASPGLPGFGTGLPENSWAPPVTEEDANEPRPMLLAQADCSAAAQQAAAQTGGEVLSVQATEQGGQTVCVVTVLIPGQGGERPRRTTITLPG